MDEVTCRVVPAATAGGPLVSVPYSWSPRGSHLGVPLKVSRNADPPEGVPLRVSGLPPFVSAGESPGDLPVMYSGGVPEPFPWSGAP